MRRCRPVRSCPSSPLLLGGLNVDITLAPRILLGHGWLVPWYLIFYFLVGAVHVPYWTELFDWCYHKKGEPAGAMGIFGVGLIWGFILGGFSSIHAIAYLIRADAPLGRKLLEVGITAAVFTVVGVVCICLLGERSMIGFYGYHVFLLAVVVANLYALHIAS